LTIHKATAKNLKTNKIQPSPPSLQPQTVTQLIPEMAKGGVWLITCSPKKMKDDHKPCRSAFGHFTLACAMIGFLLFVVYQVASLFSDMAWIDGIPNWLGFVFLFIFGCSIVWEVKLILDNSAQQYKNKANKAEMATPRKPSD
jgi:hypothetical protein